MEKNMAKVIGLLAAAAILTSGAFAADANASKKASEYKVVESCGSKEKVSVQEAYFVHDSKKAPGMVIAFKSEKDATEFALKNGGKVQQYDLIKDKMVAYCDDKVYKK